MIAWSPLQFGLTPLAKWCGFVWTRLTLHGVEIGRRAAHPSTRHHEDGMTGKRLSFCWDIIIAARTCRLFDQSGKRRGRAKSTCRGRVLCFFISVHDRHHYGFVLESTQQRYSATMVESESRCTTYHCTTEGTSVLQQMRGERCCSA